MMAWQPMCLRAAMLAREGTSVGVMVWAGPCRARKAMRAPEGSSEMVMGEEGLPQGYNLALFPFRGLTVSISTDLLS